MPLAPPWADGSVTVVNAALRVLSETSSLVACPKAPVPLLPAPKKRRSFDPLVKISLMGEHSAPLVEFTDFLAATGGVPATMPPRTAVAPTPPLAGVKDTPGTEV